MDCKDMVGEIEDIEGEGMKPIITIDKYAIRFEYENECKNFFFNDLFQSPNCNWHRKVLEAIQESYEICVKGSIEPPKEEARE